MTDEFEHAESVAFLRRFADMMSGGTNASRLQQAAEAIEDLGRRLPEALHLLQHEAELKSTYQKLCETAEASVSELDAEIAALRRQMIQQEEQQELLRAKLVEENRQLTDRAIRAEAELRARSAELADIQSQLENLGRTMLVVPADTMQAAGEQFRSLAEQFEKRGDMIATAMCEVGRLLIEQAISASRVDADGGGAVELDLFSGADAGSARSGRAI